MIRKFKNLTIKNMLSIGNITQSIILDSEGLTIVLGNNMDVDNNNTSGAKNGCGKSTALQALSYVLFNEPIENIKLDNLVNYFNKKHMLVSVEFDIDNDSYRIERGRKPAVLRLFKNSNQIDKDDALGENKHTQEEINRLLGMNHLLFTQIMGMNTYTDPFLKCKPPQQKEIIEQLLGVTVLSERDKVLVESIKETKKKITVEETIIKTTIEANTKIQSAIDRSINDKSIWLASQNNLISKLEKKVVELSEIDFDKEIEIFDEIEKYNDSIKSLNIKIEEVNKEIVSLTREKTRLENSKSEELNKNTNSLISQVERLNKEYDKCITESRKTCDTEVSRLETQIKINKNNLAKTTDADIAKVNAQISKKNSAIGNKNNPINTKTVLWAEISVGSNQPRNVAKRKR